MPEYLFSYGMLRLPEVQRQLFDRTLDGKPDALPGFRLAEIDINDPIFLATGAAKTQRIAIRTGNPDDKIEGVVLEMSDRELQKADLFEPPDYVRIEVTLASGKHAWLYAAG